jgi:hypothetical protein
MKDLHIRFPHQLEYQFAMHKLSKFGVEVSDPACTFVDHTRETARTGRHQSYCRRQPSDETATPDH